MIETTVTRAPGEAARMAARIAAFDWASTPLGDARAWPQSLRTAASIVIASRFPMALWWGPSRTQLYNDGYAPVLGAKHPRALGQDAGECWYEIWDVIGPMQEGVRRTGEATWSDDLLLVMQRYGYVEETYFTFSYSGVRSEDGDIAGVLVTCTETTPRVLSARRMDAIRDLAASSASATTRSDAGEVAMRVLERAAKDVPFAMLYTIEGRDARISAATENAARIAPAAIDLASDEAPWPIAGALRDNSPTWVRDVRARFGEVCGVWPEAVESAVVLPLNVLGERRASAALICGINPRRAIDAEYESFLGLVRSQLASALATAEARERERRRAEELAELDRAKTAFFSNVSHEFRTPLTLLLAPLQELLANADALPDAQRERIEVAHRSGLRLLKLVSTLLDFSRFEAGRAQTTYERTDLASFTADLIGLFRAAVERAGLKLSVEAEPLPEPAYVDREMWEKLVLNLVSNAFKHTFEGGIFVRIAHEGGHAIVTVRDTGVGIPREELRRIFDRFHQVRGARSRTHEGTGIGLALAAEIVRAHGGTIAAESGPGEGSTFTVRIPLGAAHLPRERLATTARDLSVETVARPYVEEALGWIDASHGVARSHSERADRSHERLLVVDDNADMRRYLERVLAPHWRVSTAASGVEALDLAMAEPPDLLVTDVMMPGLDGFQLLAALRKAPQTATMPIVVLSARAGDEAAVDGLGRGADEYIVKPFSANELVARIRSTLAIARARKSERVAREAAEAASLLKDEFLATVSHELRTPLQSILGWARLLVEQPLDEARRLRALTTIERNARAQAVLVEDLLDVSRIITGKLRLDPQPVSVAAIIDRTLETLRSAADAKGVTFTTAVHPEVGVVVGDVDRLVQVFWNLCSNAVKFVKAGGHVLVAATRDDDQIIVEIADDGDGISPTFLPHIFERFRQADAATTRRHGGLGLGLAIVRHLVELHGGAVAAASDGEGKGATFTVTLPMRASIGSSQPVEVAADGAHHGASIPRQLESRRIVVVDDEVDARELLVTVLTQSGADVRAARNADEALTLLQTFRPHALVSDIGLPEQDGYELIRKVRSFPPEDALATIPAVALTAYARHDDRARALAAGFYAHVAKPVEPNELVDVVARAIGD